MAANKFATMVQRNTNKMTLILVYAALEWTLIALLLFNSLFSYLIVKFADYFGLERPCLWCSRLDHVFEPRRSHRDLVCEAHAREISGLEYCPSHRRLAESRDLCEDCSASETDAEWSKRFGFFPWTAKQIGTIGEFVGLESELDEEEEEEEEENSKCSCCGASLSGKRFFDPCILIKPSSWGGVLDFPQKESLDVDDDRTFEADNSDHSRSEEEEDVRQEATAVEEESCAEQSKVEEAPVRHLEFYIGQEDCTLIPIVDEGESETMASLPLEPVLVSQVAQTVFEEDSKSNLHQGSEDEGEETDGEISIGTEIPDHEAIDEIEQVVETRSYQVNDSIDFHVNGNDVVEPLLVLQGTSLDTPGWSAEELRAALKAVYAELEEERSAAAVAASQTMAMINRLQEEKAAVQMEAVQYRRMMEEQSDYDRDALRDLRSDLDACRSLLRDYQATDRAFSSDDDVDDGQEEEEEERIAYTPAEVVLYFEEERISILDQLRALEENLFSLSDDDNDYKEEETDHSNGHCHHHHDHNHNHHRGAVKAKRLLPLFEAAGDGDGECERKRRGAAVTEEEVERVYERLHALEADREFLRRCVGSLRKGDKGLRLLSEILRHLRHLRTVVVDGVLA